MSCLSVCADVFRDSADILIAVALNFSKSTFAAANQCYENLNFQRQRWRRKQQNKLAATLLCLSSSFIPSIQLLNFQKCNEPKILNI